jgi:nanoRNase/pAp phosphatase (c-di-AMP/oligoRNAs hydrolase)
LVLAGHTHGGQVGLLSVGLQWTFLRLFGIKIPDHGFWARGTDDFSLARNPDFRAAAQLAEICDRDLLQDLSRRLIAPSAMDVIARALAALVVRRNFAMTGIGFVSETERDTIAQAADFLIRREDIDTVVVYGIVGDRFIEGSLRTHSPSVDPALWIEQAFGHDERGKAFGGGRRDKGGFKIPIGFLGRATDRAQLWALVEHAARQALLKQLGEENAIGGGTGHAPQHPTST